MLVTCDYFIITMKSIIILLCWLVIALQQCQHPIFCSQPILKAISKSNIFQDSKTFVDLVLKVPVQTALNYFLTKNITEFVNLSFHPDPNIILQPTTFEDYHQNPAFLLKIKDNNLRQFGRDLHRRWNELGKLVVLNSSLKVGSCLQKCSSFIEQMNNKKILVPGGRFRESYYWDTYWIILGLITSQMLSTAESILDTFAIMVNTYGFIPNGLRQYYLNRSQPPFYFLMVKKLAEAYSKKGEGEKAALLEKKYFDLILIQHSYWQDTHSLFVTVGGVKIKVNQYRAKTQSPRPQSYREDSATVANLQEGEKRRVLSCLSSMAESGWDFSSRWLYDYKSLQSTIIDQIIPSDLNALLGLQESYLASLSSKYGRQDLVPHFIERIIERRNYFKAIKRQGRFPDYHFNNQAWNPHSVYPSDYLPYLLLSEPVSTSGTFSQLVNPSSSKINTGQQWDAPNVWAPNSWIMHEVSYSHEAAQIGKQWIQTTYCSWKKTGNLYEKYRSDAFGQRGQGGQYVVQTGFGWTNGLALYYLEQYGQQYNLKDC